MERFGNAGGQEMMLEKTTVATSKV